jgi:hypothetical protein
MVFNLQEHTDDDGWAEFPTLGYSSVGTIWTRTDRRLHLVSALHLCRFVARLLGLDLGDAIRQSSS